ncbi:hypothetical protein H5410_012407 [Solanum commersonii]|uniref:Uncharacterized protein n=1 Tax=Solanum commersonii TaxID=4109 RepID=A0A9J6ARF8_SOLCO|nr:hypothetical protein H5410_012407 [Solanum commersonii]
MASGKLVHIDAGNGECSYASNSTLQRRIIEEAKPVLEDAIKKMFNNIIGEFPKQTWVALQEQTHFSQCQIS